MCVCVVDKSVRKLNESCERFLQLAPKFVDRARRPPSCVVFVEAFDQTFEFDFERLFNADLPLPCEASLREKCGEPIARMSVALRALTALAQTN